MKSIPGIVSKHVLLSTASPLKSTPQQESWNKNHSRRWVNFVDYVVYLGGDIRANTGSQLCDSASGQRLQVRLRVRQPWGEALEDFRQEPVRFEMVP